MSYYSIQGNYTGGSKSPSFKETMENSNSQQNINQLMGSTMGPPMGQPMNQYMMGPTTEPTMGPSMNQYMMGPTTEPTMGPTMGPPMMFTPNAQPMMFPPTEQPMMFLPTTQPMIIPPTEQPMMFLPTEQPMMFQNTDQPIIEHLSNPEIILNINLPIFKFDKNNVFSNIVVNSTLQLMYERYYLIYTYADQTKSTIRLPDHPNKFPNNFYIMSVSANNNTQQFTYKFYNGATLTTPTLDFVPISKNYGKEYPNNDIKYAQDEPFEYCAINCKRTEGCVGYTLHLDNKKGCWLKSKIDLNNLTNNINRDTYTIK
uniref:Apple domain-containing protein n=1 Tax=viral metagenome TaxID=1070528 RepID=A0A6C0ED47_9ZZZZ